MIAILLPVTDPMHRNKLFANAQSLRGVPGAKSRQAGVEERVCANCVKKFQGMGLRFRTH